LLPYIEYRVCIASKYDLDKYHDFAILLGQRMQRQGLNLARQYPLDVPAFYQGAVGFVSLNYDPIALWVQFIAHCELNKSADVPHIGSPTVPLHLFHDFGHLCPASTISLGRAASRSNVTETADVAGDRRVLGAMYLLDFPQDRPYTGKAGAEDRAIQGWNPSADSSAGMNGTAISGSPVCIMPAKHALNPGVWGRAPS
jgi:hypothetical protein